MIPTVLLAMMTMSFGALYIPAAANYGVAGGAGSDLNSAYTLTDALLREVVEKMGQATGDYLKYPGERRVAKDYNDDDDQQRLPPDYEALLDPQEAMIRDQEYLQHSSLWGHQFVAGGAGEGKQRLKPDGSIKNLHQIKTDSVLPAYCDPPNPCPVGYGAEDGCLETFVNTAAYSREYQAAQDCMCDTEHMFDCPSSSRQDEINALAQSIQNEGLSNRNLDRILDNLQIQDQHKSLVAKKHFSYKVHDGYLQDMKRDIRKSALKTSSNKSVENPFLKGEKLPIVAKKGSHLASM